MRRIFVDPSILTAETARISGPDAHHLLNVLRVRVGDELILLGGDGHGVLAAISQIGKRDLEARIVGPAEVGPEPRIHVTVAQALGKGDRFEQVIQHATEAGASAFVPLLTERTVVRLSTTEAEAKLNRWRMVAKGAAEQAGRARIPEILRLESLDSLLARGADHPTMAMLHLQGESLGSWSREVHVPGASMILVGPEGGFSPPEVEAARAVGVRIVTLGPYTLRTETAAIVALSRILGPTYEGG